MTIIVPHRTTAEKAISMVDRSATTLFDGVGGSPVELVDRKKSWNGPVMDFFLIARVGFISVPIAGTVAVDDINVTVQCELPGIVRQFIGEDKIQASVDRKIRGMLETAS